jgi:hypothetical protein
MPPEGLSTAEYIRKCDVDIVGSHQRHNSLQDTLDGPTGIHPSTQSWSRQMSDEVALLVRLDRDTAEGCVYVSSCHLGTG